MIQTVSDFENKHTILLLNQRDQYKFSKNAALMWSMTEPSCILSTLFDGQSLRAYYSL